MKKLFSIAAIVALLGSIVPTTFGATYSDELQGAYDYAYGMGITTQSSIDSANMYGNLIRSHMAKMMVNYAKEMGKTADNTATCNFTDIANESAELQGYMIEACQMGLMGVGITAFRPNDTVTRGEFGTVLSRVLWGDANNGGEPYYVNHLNALKDAGVMTKIDNPTMKEVRGYVMLMMQRADESNVANTKPAVCSTPENVLACSLGLDSCPAECTETEEVKPGLANVSLVGSAETRSVPRNAKSVKVGTIKLTAGENDTTVSSIVIGRSGLGNATEVSSLQLLLSNGIAATTASSRMGSAQTSTLRFSPSLVLKAGASQTFDLVVSLSGTENNEHNFSVTSVDVSNGTATGTPLSVGTVKTTSYNAGNATLDNLVGSTIVAGKANQTLATVYVTPNKDATVKGFTLTKKGGEDFTKAIANVKAYYNSEVIGNVSITNEEIVVTNLNVDRLNGEQAAIELKADGIYVGNMTGTMFNIDAEDLIVVEKASGFSMNVTGAPLASNVAIAYSTLDITLTKVTTGSKTVAPGSSSVVLYEAKIASNATFDVSNYTLSIDQGVAKIATDFVDGKVTAYINGIDYEISTGTTFSATADAFRVEPGTAVTVRVLGNVKSTAATGVTYQMSLKLNQAKNVENGQLVTLNNTLVGDTVVVGNGGYTITKPTSIPSNKTVLEGSASDVLYFNLRANAEDQVLKSVTVTSLTAFSGYASEVALMQGTTKVKSFTNTTDLSGTTLTFDSLSTTLKKDTTVPFTVRVTLKAGEVVNLGTNVQVSMSAVNVVRSVNHLTATTTSSTMVAGNTYQIASNVPTVALPSQDGKNTIISFASTSSYDVEIFTGTIEMTRNLVNGSYVNWSGTVKVLDSINGTVVGTSAGSAPGAITLGFTNLTVDTAAVDRVIELVDPANTVTDADYTVTVKNVSFRYVDRNDPAKKSAVITESYNVAK